MNYGNSNFNDELTSKAFTVKAAKVTASQFEPEVEDPLTRLLKSM